MSDFAIFIQTLPQIILAVTGIIAVIKGAPLLASRNSILAEQNLLTGKELSIRETEIANKFQKTRFPRTWKKDNVALEDTADAIREAQSLGFKSFAFELITGINPNEPPFFNIRASTAELIS